MLSNYYSNVINDFFDLQTTTKVEYDDFAANFDEYRKWFADKIETYLAEVSTDELEFLKGLLFHNSIFLQVLLYIEKPLVYNKEQDHKFRFSTSLAKTLSKEHKISIEVKFSPYFTKGNI